MTSPASSRAPGRSTLGRQLDPLPQDACSFLEHHVPLDDAPRAYEQFQKKEDGYFKVVLTP